MCYCCQWWVTHNTNCERAWFLRAGKEEGSARPLVSGKQNSDLARGGRLQHLKGERGGDNTDAMLIFTLGEEKQPRWGRK